MYLKSLLKVCLLALIGFALTSCATNNYMDTQQHEFEMDLSDELNQHEIEIARMSDGSLKLYLDGGTLFSSDSTTINPTFRHSLDKLSRVLQKYDRTAIYVIGHTDNTGTASHNQTLSERRADAVAGYLSKYGIPERRLHTEGRGEREPRASNNTAEGRRSNRRVDLYIKLS